MNANLRGRSLASWLGELEAQLELVTKHPDADSATRILLEGARWRVQQAERHLVDPPEGRRA